MVHLHCRSWYSFLQGASSPAALVEVARSHGQRALALTDLHGVYGCVEMARACREADMQHIPGATLRVVGAPGAPERIISWCCWLAMHAATTTSAVC